MISIEPAATALVPMPQTSGATLDLSGKGIRVITRETLGYRGELVVDLSGNPFHFVPKWVSELPGLEKIVINNNISEWEVSFESGFNSKVLVESIGNDLMAVPDNLLLAQMICDKNLTPAEGHQSGEISL